MSSNKLRLSDLATWLPSLTRSRFGVAKLERPFSMEFYDQWLAEGRQGEMQYLERHRDLKADPVSWLPFARSALVFAIDYGPGHQAEDRKKHYVTSATNLRTALYTRYAPEQADYHDVIRTELQPVLASLHGKYPDAEFRLALDAQPILERDLAVRAGLGWVGKNTCVIDRDGGSLFFIAEILTSLETDAALIAPQDFCGTCTRCMDSCPTSALVAPRKLDATKCISYWTIESKKIPPRDLREKFGDWFYGCDICQTVCPWNGKVYGREEMARELEPRQQAREDLIRELGSLLSSSNRELQRRFEGTPFERARGFGLKRNALIVVGNLRLKELLPTIETLVDDEKLGTLARETRALIAEDPLPDKI